MSADLNESPAETQAGRVSYGRLAAWIFLFFLVLYVGLTRGHFCIVDEIEVFQQTRSLWERGDLSTSNLAQTLPGRAGNWYAVFGAGQSILALPLYGMGKGVHRLRDGAAGQSWLRILAGPVFGDDPQWRRGDEVEIFFVNLFNSIAVAALAAVFFAFNLRLGAAPRWALAATLLFGLTTHIAGFSTGFWQHAAESLFLLWTFYFLFCDSRNPGWRTRALAGGAAALMMLVRVSTLTVLPALVLYLAWNIWKRTPPDPAMRIREGIRQFAPFAIPAAAGILAMAVVNYAKFGAFSVAGSYSRLVPLNNPLLVGLYGYLFSVGASIFLFTPLLILAPQYFAGFRRRYRAETIAIAAMALASLLFYSKAYLWHGQWAFGPRYLVHLVPLLLLPLGCWLQNLSRAMWVAVALLALAGLWVQILHIAVSVSYVYGYEHYADFQPPFGYLFIPDFSQVPAHWRALQAWDQRVDFWLLNVFRLSGWGGLLDVAAPLLVLLCGSAWRLTGALREAEAAFSFSSGAMAPSFATDTPYALRTAALVWLAAIVWILESQ